MSPVAISDAQEAHGSYLTRHTFDSQPEKYVVII